MDQALAEVVDTLQKDPPLLYHINALLKSEEWRGVLKGALSGGDDRRKACRLGRGWSQIALWHEEVQPPDEATWRH